MVNSIIASSVNSVVVLTPYTYSRQPLPELGEGARVEIRASYYGASSRTVQATIERLTVFTSPTVPGYSDRLYGLRTDDGHYQLMFTAELKRRLVSYLWGAN